MDNIFNTSDDKLIVINEAYELYQRMILRFTTRCIGDRRKAEEMTQEVFYLAQVKYSKFSLASNKKAWLLRVAKILVLRHFSRDKKKEALYVPLTDDDYGLLVTSDYYFNNLDEYRKYLNDKEFRMLQCKYLYDLTNKDIAEVMKMPSRNCDKQLQRIRDKIRTKMIESDRFHQ